MGSPSTTLVLLAAGLGRRFGGPKQLVPIGPDGEPIFVITARDGLAAGFDRVVVVTRTELRSEIDELIARYLADLPITVVLQDRAGPARDKPWGTAHAVAAVLDELDGPMGLANGDDLYGTAVEVLARCVARLDEDAAVVVGYRLGDTLSDQGPVNRAVCEVAGGANEGPVAAIAERYELVADGDSVIDGDGRRFDPSALVSMNLIGFGRGVVGLFADGFTALAEAHESDGEEYVIPDELARHVAAGAARLDCVAGSGQWMGMTTRADLEPLRRRYAATVGQ